MSARSSPLSLIATLTNTDARDIPFHCEYATTLLVEYGPVRGAAPFSDSASGVGIVAIDTVAYEVRLVVLFLEIGRTVKFVALPTVEASSSRTTIVPVKFALAVKLQSVGGLRADGNGDDRASTY